ncbi:MAG: phytanoyl-CoA dioxygenase family protein [Planctomycetota bacterium]
MELMSVLESEGCCLAKRLFEPVVVRDLIKDLDGREGLTRRGNAFARRNLLDETTVREVAERDEVRAVVEKALSSDAVAVRGLLFDKTPAANWTVPWHQDRAIAVTERQDVDGYGPWSLKQGVVHVQPPVEVLRRMVTVRIHLDDCFDDNGPLRVVPGHHHNLLDPAALDTAVAAGPERRLTGAAGSAVVMRPLTLHASSPAKSPSHRRVLHLEFSDASLDGGLRWAFA